MKTNHLFDFLDKCDGLPVGSSTAAIEKEKTRQGCKGNMRSEYEAFKMEWEKTHSISKAPSFTSWKELYRNA